MSGFREWLRARPLLGPLARSLRRFPWASRNALRRLRFQGSARHWERHYAGGGSSGSGSFGRLAEFKAEILNGFVRDQGVHSVVELGCGDGRQLALAQYPAYLGLDVSARAIELCRERFRGDASKRFQLYDPRSFRADDSLRAELALSLDVIFHLVEDDVFERYMTHLFELGRRYVIIFSSDHEHNPLLRAPHIRHRRFSQWVRERRPGFRLLRVIPNRYPYQGDARSGSYCDFHLYERASDEGSSVQARST
ncbi:MAG: class I SAM-dependent methyltransferase [Myxococcota bacterium]